VPRFINVNRTKRRVEIRPFEPAGFRRPSAGFKLESNVRIKKRFDFHEPFEDTLALLGRERIGPACFPSRPTNIKERIAALNRLDFGPSITKQRSKMPVDNVSASLNR